MRATIYVGRNNEMALSKGINKKRYDLFTMSRDLYKPSRRRNAIIQFKKLCRGDLKKLLNVDKRLYYTVLMAIRKEPSMWKQRETQHPQSRSPEGTLGHAQLATSVNNPNSQ